MEKIDELKSKLIELSEKYAKVINTFEAYKTGVDASIVENNEVLANVTEKIATQDKLCNALLDAGIKIPQEKRAYKNTAKFCAILISVVGIISSFYSGEFALEILFQYLIMELGIGGLSVAGYLFETRKERKLLKKYNYKCEYAKQQELEETKKESQRLEKVYNMESFDYELEISYYKDELTQIQETLNQLINDELTLVDQPEVMTERCSQVMSLIREKSEKMPKFNY